MKIESILLIILIILLAALYQYHKTNESLLYKNFIYHIGEINTMYKLSFIKTFNSIKLAIKFILEVFIFISLIIYFGQLIISKVYTNYTTLIITGLIGLVSAFIIYKLQSLSSLSLDKSKAFKDTSLLMKQLLYAYNRVIGLSDQGKPEYSDTVHNDFYEKNIIFLNDWSKHLIHLEDIEDIQNIAMFLNVLEKLNLNELEERYGNLSQGEGFDFVRNTFYGIGKNMIRMNIDSILLKYDKLYLHGEFKKKYRVEYPYQ